MNFFVLGNEDVVLGFQFIGIKGKVINNEDDALNEFKNVINANYGEIAVLLVTEKVVVMIEKELLNWQLSCEFPLLVEIPDLDGHLEGRKTLLQSIREAIGLPV
ncbi:MAG: ATPase V [Spirochaetes bacterium]|nr:ATPase V [Spirochaetota bacterium]